MVRRTDTRQRMLESAADLFHTQGYHATGLNQLLSAGGAPKGSLYFHFPGGKEQLAAEALTISAARLHDLLRQQLHSAPDPASAVRAVVDALARELETSGFQRGCPIATVAMDAGTESEPIRTACAEGYSSWHTVIEEYLVTQGFPPAEAARLSIIALTSIEGALMLAKLDRDLAPLRTVGDHLHELFNRTTRSARDGGAPAQEDRSGAEPRKDTGGTLMRVHHFNAGTIRPIGGRLIDGRRGLLRRAELVCHCLLIEAGDELVLVETGMGTPAVDRPGEWLGKSFVRLVGARPRFEETAVAQVKRLGFAPEDVRHIVLTHLDLDHAGGLVDFPHATVHVYAEELRTVQSPIDRSEEWRYRQVQFAHGPLWSSYPDLGEPWFGFEAVRDLKGLPPEILLVPLAGHTRGHAGVAVDTGDGWLLHAGDSYFHHREIDPVAPYIPLGLKLFEARVQTVRGPRLENQRRLRELARTGEVSLFTAHDPVDLRRFANPA